MKNLKGKVSINHVHPYDGLLMHAFYIHVLLCSAISNHEMYEMHLIMSSILI